MTLQCTITSTTSTVTNVFWQRTNGNIVTTINFNTNANKYSGSTTSSPSLVIFNTASSDSGQYTCHATNAVGTGQSSFTTLSVTTSQSKSKQTRVKYVLSKALQWQLGKVDSYWTFHVETTNNKNEYKTVGTGQNSLFWSHHIETTNNKNKYKHWRDRTAQSLTH